MVLKNIDKSAIFFFQKSCTVYGLTEIFFLLSSFQSEYLRDVEEVDAEGVVCVPEVSFKSSVRSVECNACDKWGLDVIDGDNGLIVTSLSDFLLIDVTEGGYASLGGRGQTSIERPTVATCSPHHKCRRGLPLTVQYQLFKRRYTRLEEHATIQRRRSHGSVVAVPNHRMSDHLGQPSTSCEMSIDHVQIFWMSGAFHKTIDSLPCRPFSISNPQPTKNTTGEGTRKG